MPEERSEPESATGATEATWSTEAPDETYELKVPEFIRAKAGHAQTVAHAADMQHIAASGPHSAADEEDELSKAVEEAIADVERARVMMQRDQAEIEQLKSETRMLISRLLAA